MNLTFFRMVIRRARKSHAFSPGVVAAQGCMRSIWAAHGRATCSRSAWRPQTSRRPFVWSEHREISQQRDPDAFPNVLQRTQRTSRNFPDAYVCSYM